MGPKGIVAVASSGVFVAGLIFLATSRSNEQARVVPQVRQKTASRDPEPVIQPVPAFLPAPVAVEHVVTAPAPAPIGSALGELAAHAETAPAALPPTRETPADVAARLESALQDDGPPNERSLQLERQAREIFAGQQGGTLRAVECRATRCRVEVDFADAAADRALMRSVFLTGNGDLAKFALTIPIREKRANGSLAATIYLYPPIRPEQLPPDDG